MMTQVDILVSQLAAKLCICSDYRAYFREYLPVSAVPHCLCLLFPAVCVLSLFARVCCSMMTDST